MRFRADGPHLPWWDGTFNDEVTLPILPILPILPMLTMLTILTILTILTNAAHTDQC